MKMMADWSDKYFNLSQSQAGIIKIKEVTKNSRKKRIYFRPSTKNQIRKSTKNIKLSRITSMTDNNTLLKIRMLGQGSRLRPK